MRETSALPDLSRHRVDAAIIGIYLGWLPRNQGHVAELFTSMHDREV
jgi:hypothetical protein